MKKSIFQMVCFILLTVTATNTIAQTYENLSQEEKEQKSIALIDEAEVLVLATPVGEKCFYGEDGRTIYSKIKIRVKHWYKGDGNRTIYMIRRGGIIGDDKQVSRHVRPGLQFNMYYFMLLKKEDKHYKFVSNINASYGRYANIYSDNPIIVAFYGMKFDSNTEMNEFLEKLNGVKLPSKRKTSVFENRLERFLK